jgi:hypothetical protein
MPHKAKEGIMDLVGIVYLVALVGVAVALVALVAEAVLSTARPPIWLTQRFKLSQPTPLAVVATTDRRALQLDYVGSERRGQTAAATRPAPLFAPTRV